MSCVCYIWMPLTLSTSSQLLRNYYVPSKQVLRRNFVSHPYPPGHAFTFFPQFFSRKEQRLLLSASLKVLDSTDTRLTRRRRADFFKSKLPQSNDTDPIMEIFAPDDLYHFQEVSPKALKAGYTYSQFMPVSPQGHYDGVIKHFREIHLSSWPLNDFNGLEAAVERLHSLCPTTDIQTHLLHLASYGDIFPHVDNISASGTWIIGVSLGDERILKMTEVKDEKREFCVALPSGSVYLQRSVGLVFSIPDD